MHGEGWGHRWGLHIPSLPSCARVDPPVSGVTRPPAQFQSRRAKRALIHVSHAHAVDRTALRSYQLFTLQSSRAGPSGAGQAQASGLVGTYSLW